MSLPILAVIVLLNLNEHRAFNWPSVRTLEAVALTSSRSSKEVKVELTAYCFFNHPSLRSGTVLRTKARLTGNARAGRSVEFRSTTAVMKDGRVVTFAERVWKIPVTFDEKRRAYVVATGTELEPGSFEGAMTLAAR